MEKKLKHLCFIFLSLSWLLLGSHEPFVNERVSVPFKIFNKFYWLSSFHIMSINGNWNDFLWWHMVWNESIDRIGGFVLYSHFAKKNGLVIASFDSHVHGLVDSQVTCTNMVIAKLYTIKFQLLSNTFTHHHKRWSSVLSTFEIFGNRMTAYNVNRNVKKRFLSPAKIKWINPQKNDRKYKRMATWCLFCLLLRDNDERNFSYMKSRATVFSRDHLTFASSHLWTCHD